MASRRSDLEQLHSILREGAVPIHGVTLYDSEKTIKIVEIAKRQKLQLAEINYFLLHADGKIQPSYSNNISIFANTFEDVREKIILYGEKSYFELLSVGDLLSEINALLKTEVSSVDL
jgi:hypothetical protein